MSNTIARFTALAVLCAMLTPVGAPAVAWAADTEETPTSATEDGFDAARTLVDAGQYDQALPALRQLDRQSPDNPDVLNLIGFSLRKTGHMADALDHYNRALALDPGHLGANEYLGELYLEAKQPEKARERLEVLRQVCGDCEEFRDLQTAISRYAAN